MPTLVWIQNKVFSQRESHTIPLKIEKSQLILLAKAVAPGDLLPSDKFIADYVKKLNWKRYANVSCLFIYLFGISSNEIWEAT